METELTKKIKKACHTYKPQLNTTMRTIRYADEVVCPNGGIVDVVRFEDYIVYDESFCEKLNPELMSDNDREIMKKMNISAGSCKLGKEYTFDKERCKGCVYKKTSHILDMLVTCYEVKISVSDFKSKHGHNFFGNRNYYVVNAEIYENIKELVPNDIGIIVYYKDSGYMKTKRECKHIEIDNDVKITLLYNALKKWCDGQYYIPF